MAWCEAEAEREPERGQEELRAQRPCQTRSYMQMYAFALRTSSSVVRRTTVSLMYAHWRGWRRGSDVLLERDSCDDGDGADLSDSGAGVGSGVVVGVAF